MSTRSSIIYSEKNGVHIYMEMNDNNNIYLEVEKEGVEIICKLMSCDEWVAMGLPNKYVEPTFESGRTLPAVVNKSESESLA